MTPTADRVIVKPDADLAQTAGGLFIPGVYRATQNAGVVVAIGKGKMLKSGTRATWDVEMGDHVLYSRYNGHEWGAGDDARVTLRSRDLIAILT